MEELEEDNGFEVREELMISPNGGPKPTKRLGHFLKPCINFIKGQVFELPTHCLSSLAPIFEPKSWPLNVNFHGWRPPQKKWKAWVGRMAGLCESTWKKAGIHEAILNSTNEIRINYDLILGLAKKCPLETDELMETQEKLNQAAKELNRSTAKKPSVFPIAVKLARGTRIAHVPAVLAGIYIDLSFLKEKIVALSLVDSWEDENRKLEITIWSPFQLVQIWARERFKDLRPEPSLIMRGEPRFAQWHKLMMGDENVPMFYGEKEMRVLVDGDLPEELQSWGQCLRVSELLGLDHVEQYFPHRITRQFGMDQDLPACVAPANESPKSACSSFCKPVTYAKLYIPSRHYEAGRTTRYLKRWKKSLSRLQSTSDGALPQERNLLRSKIIPKGSKGKRENSFHGLKKNPKKAKRMKEMDAAASTCSHFALKSLERSPKTSKRKNIDGDFSLALKTESASVELPSNRPSLGLEVKKDANVPPCFPPKSNHVVTTDSTEEDCLTIAELMKSRKKHDGFWNERVANAENLPDQSEAFSSTAEWEVVKVIPPETESVKKIMKNVPVNVGSEMAVEDSTDGKAGNPSHDMVRIQNGEGGGSKCDCCDMSKRQILHLEEWISRLEAVVAKLKAGKFHYKSQP
ncbi:PMD domain-containing protein [Citrus sinensis]|uniref:PMD domain-containing protein n=1 Tax=Citrus sinensis TaxID=2711 RepID=A0ACB8P069_CITSI|nr:PMD domain-containing protein [Citrus sinensis]